MRTIGVDVGVKGAVWVDDPKVDQPKFMSYDVTKIGTGEGDKLYRAVLRGLAVSGIVSQLLPAGGSTLLIDTPVFTGPKGAHGWGMQCALYGVLVGILKHRTTVTGDQIQQVKGKEARAALGITTRGKAGIIEWAKEDRSWRFLTKNEGPWQREALAEAYMLAKAGRVMMGGEAG